MVAASTSSGSGGSRSTRLTPAESRVLVLLATHLTLAAIGARLGLTRATVKTHVAHIYKKLEVGTRGAAVERAEELGLLDAADWRTGRGPEKPYPERT